VVAGVAAAVLLASWVLVAVLPVPAWEQRLVAWVNAAPDVVAALLYPVMQAGTVAATVVTAIAVYVLTRDRALALTTAAAGMAAWLLAKGVKAAVGRGRPLEYLPQLDVRDGDGGGLGFVSGHSAVAAALATCLIVATPPRWRVVPIVIVVLVGVARLVVGVHLPMDLVGGWALGVLVAVAALAVMGATTAQGRTSVARAT
jgi:undecaprenyl-diphosphatase